MAIGIERCKFMAFRDIVGREGIEAGEESSEDEL